MSTKAKRIRTCGQNWAEHESEILLSQVQKYREIWDPSLLCLKNNTIDIWDKIAVELSRSRKECIQKWTALKTYYRNELNKEQTKNYVCNWRHKRSMQFYLPHLRPNHVSIKTNYLLI